MNEARPEGLILLVDDEEDHVDLMRLALEALALPIRLEAVRDGQDCLAYLRREGGYAQAPRPDLVLMDVNMPRMNGPEAVAAIRADARLRTQVVIALSTSADPADVRRMYQAGCNCYLVKPLDFDAFMAMLRDLHGFWLRWACLDR